MDSDVLLNYVMLIVFFPVVFIMVPAIILVIIAVAAGMGAYNRWEKRVFGIPYGTPEPEEDDSDSDSDSSDAYSFGNSWAKLAEELNHD